MVGRVNLGGLRGDFFLLWCYGVGGQEQARLSLSVDSVLGKELVGDRSVAYGAQRKG